MLRRDRGRPGCRPVLATPNQRAVTFRGRGRACAGELTVLVAAQHLHSRSPGSSLHRLELCPTPAAAKVYRQ